MMFNCTPFVPLASSFCLPSVLVFFVFCFCVCMLFLLVPVHCSFSSSVPAFCPSRFFCMVINHANDAFVAGHHAVGICMLKRYIFQDTPQGSSFGQYYRCCWLILWHSEFLSPLYHRYGWCISPHLRTNPDASVVKCYFHFHMNFVSIWIPYTFHMFVHSSIIWNS